MSPRTGRPKSENPKSRQFRMRLSEEEFSNLEQVAKQKSMTKTEVVMRGIELVKSEKTKQPRTPIAKQSVLSYRTKETLSEIIISEKSFFVIPQRSFYYGKK